MASSQLNTKTVAALVALLLLGGLWWVTKPAIDPKSGLAWVELRDLPPEAATVVDKINSGEPFEDTEHDGVTFFNREGLLPDQDTGYYREYTVPTPGSEDRGARRIVAGRAGELYWTDDHYDSFQRIESDQSIKSDQRIESERTSP